MSDKDITQILRDRMGIESLNSMQCATLDAWESGDGDLVLYSPTGSGKTLAFVLCLIHALNPPTLQLQAVVMSPSRELVLQTTEVMRKLAIGYKVTPCYGGHATADEIASLTVTPDVVIATPGRLLDLYKRGLIDLKSVRLLVLDEMDKALELGFENEMRQLLKPMGLIERRILASATVLEMVPDYVKLSHPVCLNRLSDTSQVANRIKVWQALSSKDDKLDTLRQLLLSLNGNKTIVFANYRDAAERIHGFLIEKGIDAGLYHGALGQQERECVVAMFNNGSHNVLVATDLASRGLDIDTISNVVHYHLPLSEKAYIHRNGRTARMDASGNAFVITGPSETLPEWITTHEPFSLNPVGSMLSTAMATLYFQAGRKEKINRGDILGFIANNGDVQASDIGRIDVRDHYALAAVPRGQAQDILQSLRSAKIKGKKVRISLLK